MPAPSCPPLPIGGSKVPCFCCKAAEKGTKAASPSGMSSPVPLPQVPPSPSPQGLLAVPPRAAVSTGPLRGVHSTQGKKTQNISKGLGVPVPAATLSLPSSPGLGLHSGQTTRCPSREITAQNQWHLLPQHMAVTRSSRSPCPSPAWPRRPPKIAWMYVRHPLEQTDPIM